jgi:acid-sensing ion channel, other
MFIRMSSFVVKSLIKAVKSENKVKMGIFQEYMTASTLHGAKYVMDEKFNRFERLFWVACIILSWIGSIALIKSSITAFENNAISFVVESSYRDWSTQFPSVFICENKNMDRIQKAATELFGEDHDFTIEEMLSEIVYFRGESYHTVHECTGDDIVNESCLYGNYSFYTNYVR